MNCPLIIHFKLQTFITPASNSSIAPCCDVPLRVLDPEQKQTGSDGPKAGNMSTTPKVFGWERESERLEKYYFYWLILGYIRGLSKVLYFLKNDINDLQRTPMDLSKVYQPGDCGPILRPRKSGQWGWSLEKNACPEQPASILGSGKQTELGIEKGKG